MVACFLFRRWSWTRMASKHSQHPCRTCFGIRPSGDVECAGSILVCPSSSAHSSLQPWMGTRWWMIPGFERRCSFLTNCSKVPEGFLKGKPTQAANEPAKGPTDEGRKLCSKHSRAQIRWFQSTNEWKVHSPSARDEQSLRLISGLNRS